MAESVANRWIIGIACVAGAVIVTWFIWAAMTPPAPESGETRLSRIDQSCSREYGPDQDAINSCKIRLMIEAVDKQNADKARRAREGAGF